MRHISHCFCVRNSVLRGIALETDLDDSPEPPTQHHALAAKKWARE